MYQNVMQNHGGWTGPFSAAVRAAAEEVLSDGGPHPVAITVFNGPALTGTLCEASTHVLVVRLRGNPNALRGINISDIRSFQF
jgi:hypothetical protein